MLRHITGLILLLASFNAYSQNIRTANIQWTSPSFLEIKQGNAVASPTTITTSAEQITWQNADSVIYQMSILQATGTWANVSQNGSIRFQVLIGQNNGTVEFEKTSGGTRATIFIVESEETRVYEIAINNVESM